MRNPLDISQNKQNPHGQHSFRHDIRSGSRRTNRNKHTHIRISNYDAQTNNQKLATDLELREKTRDEANLLRNEAYKANVA